MSIHFNISPIKGLDSIFDDCGYIICSMENLELSGPNVLKVSFMDVGEHHPYAFKKEHAEAIITFVRDAIRKDIEEFYVCCDAGESRSPAVTAALLEAFGQDSGHIWEDSSYHPNKHVYEVMREVLKYKKAL